MKNDKEITIKSYDITAYDYQQQVNNFKILPELKAFISKIKENSKILDLGCGPGHHSKYFKMHGYDVVGIDLSPVMIRIAKEEVLGVDFKIMDIQNLEFENNYFQGIWASASLLHISKKDIPNVLSKLYSILTEKGVFYLSMKEGSGEILIDDNRYGNVKKFYSYFTLNELKKILEDIGFEILESKVRKKRKFYDTNSWIHIFCKK